MPGDYPFRHPKDIAPHSILNGSCFDCPVNFLKELAFQRRIRLAEANAQRPAEAGVHEVVCDTRGSPIPSLTDTGLTDAAARRPAVSGPVIPPTLARQIGAAHLPLHPAFTSVTGVACRKGQPFAKTLDNDRAFVKM